MSVSYIAVKFKVAAEKSQQNECWMVLFGRKAILKLLIQLISLGILVIIVETEICELKQHLPASLCGILPPKSLSSAASSRV